ncbi:MAG: histidine kinase [Cyclobacteriaceae bacterium]|nr:histidine kinase [Cyclobacteriaceae bacterium]
MWLFNIREVYVRWFGIPILAYVMTFFHPLDPGETIVHRYFVALVFTTLYWNGAFMLFMYYRKRFPEIKQTPRRLLLTVLSLVTLMVVVDPILCYVLNNQTLDQILAIDNVVTKTTINLVVALVIGSIYENVYFFEQWKKSIQLNEALKNQQIRTQFEVLQNQMSPHFLFNSLNALSTLIAEDSKTAIEFTEKLSEVYRYILQNRDREVVKLKEELEFARNYMFLLKIRYPQNLSVDFEVSDDYMNMSIAPLTIQILLENAIKHNVISKTHPLHVSVYIEGNSVVVKNNLQRKNVIEKSTKTGLMNIRNRYAYFGKEVIKVDSTDDSFVVSIPLLHIKGETSVSASIV